MIDGVKLAVGTLSLLPAPMPSRVDRVVAGRAMLFAPAVGLLLGGIAGAVVAGVDALRPDAPLLSAALGVVVLAALSGALHLDGLADLADGLGSRRDRETMLRIMKQGDIGPFGVASIAGVLLIDVAAVTACVQTGFGWQALVIAGTASRLSLPWSCRTGVPSARPDGLGAMVAGTVRPTACTLVTLLILALTTALTWLTATRPPNGSAADGSAADRSFTAGSLADGSLTVGSLTGGALTGGPPASGSLVTVVGAAAAVVLAVLTTQAVVRKARTALGGVTGDVLGAGVELSLTTTLLTLALTT